MKRTIDMMTAARAKGVELPGEWFTRVCKCCFDKYTPEVDAVQFADNCWRGQPILPRDQHIYIGPDLTDPRNLHAAFRLADALCRPGFRAEVLWSADRKLFSGAVDGSFDESFSPERHLALIAACEAALGIQHGKEIA